MQTEKALHHDGNGDDTLSVLSSRHGQRAASAFPYTGQSGNDLQEQRLQLRQRIAELRAIADEIRPSPRPPAGTMAEIDHRIPWYMRNFHVLQLDASGALRPGDEEYRRLVENARSREELYARLLSTIRRRYHVGVPMGGPAGQWEARSLQYCDVHPAPAFMSSRAVGSHAMGDSHSTLDTDTTHRLGDNIEPLTDGKGWISRGRRSYMAFLEALRYEEELIAQRMRDIEYNSTRSAQSRWWELRDSRFSDEVRRVNAVQFRSTGYEKVRFVTRSCRARHMDCLHYSAR